MLMVLQVRNSISTPNSSLLALIISKNSLSKFNIIFVSGNGGDEMDAHCTHDTYDANVIEFKEACYARCNCWTDLPSQGGISSY